MPTLDERRDSYYEDLRQELGDGPQAEDLAEDLAKRDHDEALAEQQRQEDLWQDNDPFADSGDE